MDTAGAIIGVLSIIALVFMFFFAGKFQEWMEEIFKDKDSNSPR